MYTMKYLQYIACRGMQMTRTLSTRKQYVLPLLRQINREYSNYFANERVNLHQYPTSASYNFQYSTASSNAVRLYSTNNIMSLNEYNDIVNETLEDLADHFEDIADEGLIEADEFDCVLADGVLTANLGRHGVYVINKQTPNRQIWLSSPISGPKRYDLVDDTWCYSHENVTLHELLNIELSELLEADIDFTHLAFGKKK